MSQLLWFSSSGNIVHVFEKVLVLVWDEGWKAPDLEGRGLYTKGLVSWLK